MTWRWCALLTCVGLATAASAAVPSSVALIGATLIDGTGKAAIPDAVVLLRGDRIIRAGPRAQVRIPPHVRRVNLSGKWLIPGLVDAHVHFFETGRLYTKAPPAPTSQDSPRDPLDYQDLVPYAAEAAWAQSRLPITLRGYLCAGVTTAISVGGPPFEDQVKERAKRLNLAPNIFTVVGPISTVDPAKVFLPFAGGLSTVQALTGQEARRVVIAGAARGVDGVKILRFDIPDEADPTAVFAAAIEEAHSRQLPVFVHEFELKFAKRWITMGADVMAHTVAFAPVDEEFLSLVISRHVVNVTTANLDDRFVAVIDRKTDLLPVEQRCADPDVVASWSHVRNSSADQEFRDQATRNDTNFQANLRLLFRSGAMIATGSDAGNIGLIHGASLHRELLTLAAIGMPPIEIIQAATLNGARAIHKETLFGSIESGKLADVVVLDKNPLSDIRNMQSIVTVIKGGKFISINQLTPAGHTP